jgi:hypothetical protein
MAGTIKSAIVLLMTTALLFGNVCRVARAQENGASNKLPDDRELESEHARIGRIVIEVDDIFEQEIHAGIYRAANALHISTRRATIAEQLLFHSGDAYERRVLDETERLLRSQRYLNAASIEPVAYHEDNTVDVIVRVHDVWTFQPGISFGRKGGENTSRIELEETNFLGLGKHISLASSANADRNSVRAAYGDPNLFGSHWRMSASYADLSDGSDSFLGFSRPFYSLDDRWSFDINGADSQNAGALYSLGHVVSQFEVHRKSFEIGGGWSSGLRGDYALRYLGGFRYQGREFAPNAATIVLPDDRVLAYPWIGVERLQDAYLETRNLDQIGRTEDINLGNVLHLEVGYGSSAFGATRDSLLFNGLAQSGAELTAAQYVIGSVAFNGRLESGQLRNTTIVAAGRYYKRQSEHRVFFSSVQYTRALNLDPEEQVLLGGDNGLRGYPLRYQSGTSRVLAVLEERFYTNWQPLKLFNVGAAVFVDAGRTWGTDATAVAPVAWLADAGIGLRIGSARSAHGNILHIDVAFPLGPNNAPGEQPINDVQLLIETRRSF